MSWPPRASYKGGPAALTARERSSAAKWKRVRFTDNREQSTKSLAIGGFGCWCGEPPGHDWPGRDGGAPHPRAGQTGGSDGVEGAACSACSY